MIDLLPEQKEVADLGGTMRLGADPIKLHDGTRAREIYGEAVIYERHRHRYEVNNLLRKRLQSGGSVVSPAPRPTSAWWRRSSSSEHPFFVASQFHPEFKSRPERPAPLFREFVAAALRAGRRSGAERRDEGPAEIVARAGEARRRRPARERRRVSARRSGRGDALSEPAVLRVEAVFRDLDRRAARTAIAAELIARAHELANLPEHASATST